MPSTLLISPHLDDAVLSCGGGIARLVTRGFDVTVVTVFTADVGTGEPLSPLARRSHASWGLGHNPFEPRKDEDEVAMDRLGTRGIHLGLHDAVYRRDEDGRPLYARPVRVPIHIHDVWHLLPTLCDVLAGPLQDAEGAHVVCPLGLGGHVDHLLVRVAVEVLHDPRELVYYEEYPYLTSAEDTHPSPQEAARRVLSVMELTPPELDARAEAIACYRSQLRGLFPSGGERVREILSARVPVFGRLLDTPDTRPPLDRVRENLSRDLEACGGERYWCPESSPLLPLFAEGAREASMEYTRM